MRIGNSLFYVKGKVELMIGKDKVVVKAPVKFETDSNVYHKLLAMTDIKLVIDRDDEKAS